MTAMNQQVSIPETSRAGLASRVCVLAFGLVSYLVFFGTFLYLVGFVGAWFVPKHVDNGPAGPIWLALAVDALLVLAFAIQHEIMARPAFKAWFTRIVPHAMERSVFVLLASLILIAMFAFWRPIDAVLWRTEGAMYWVITAIAASGWLLALSSTFLINHFDLFGLRQVILNVRNMPYKPVGFKLWLAYRFCRHPLMLGFIIAFWAAPVMTAGRLWFAILMTAFILVGIRFEERDLIAKHGEEYLRYKRNVRGLVPIPKKSVA
jgi:protein-S-isoprenylcysteine O-methyltransferase Ste14